MKKLRAKRPRPGDPPIPIYYQLQKELQRGIEEGRWSPGDRIPPERKIAEDFGVSLGTVNKALMNLVSEGYLYRVQGKGTFVSGTHIPPESVRYTRLRAHFNDPDPAFKIRLLELKRVEGRQPVNKYLKLRINQGLYRLKRVFYTRTGPIVYNISFLPQRLFDDFDQLSRVYLEKNTLYETVEHRYGLPTVFNQEIFRVALASREVAKALEIDPGRPVLKIEMLSFTYKEKPYEYRISYYLGDHKGIFREM